MKTLRRSFAGGEIAPEMFGRLDLTKFQTGLQLARNFVTLPHGPAARRPGFKFVNYTHEGQLFPATLVPFVFSDDQAYVLEFGPGTLRFHNVNGTLLEDPIAITSISAASPGLVTTTTPSNYDSNDLVYVVTSSGPAELNGRFVKAFADGASTFTLHTPAGDAIDTTGFDAYVSGGTVARAYTVVTPYDGSERFRFAQNADILTISADGFPTKELRRLGATEWELVDVDFAVPLAAPTGVASVETRPETAGSEQDQEYVVTAVAADGVTESLASSSTTCTNNLSIYGNFNTISWDAVVGAARYFVYKKRGGAFGYIGQTIDLELKDENILPDSLTTPPSSTIALNDSADNYPSAVAYYEQRRWFGGTPANPQTVYATRNATESNLTSSIPSRADDGLEFRIASQRQNAIRHLVPLQDLIALTSGAEYRIFADGQPFITPTSLSTKPQSFAGSSSVQPAMTQSSALYVQAQGSRIREVAYDPSGTGFYRSVDASLFAPHLFDGYEITQVAFSRAPNQILWCVRSDGALVAMTYVPDQSVIGWHRHDTDGEFESVCTIPEGGEDVLYAVVKRTTPDDVTQRTIERISSRVFSEDADAFFVDCGATYDGTPATVISGLWHLEGRTVQVLADGADEDDMVVENGTITLAEAASKVHVGIGYNSDLQTLPAVMEQTGAGGQGLMKNVSTVYLRVAQSSVVKAGPSFTNLVENNARAVSDPYGSAPALASREIAIKIAPAWDTDGAVCVRQARPLPLTVVSITTETATGG